MKKFLYLVKLNFNRLVRWAGHVAGFSKEEFLHNFHDDIFWKAITLNMRY